MSAAQVLSSFDIHSALEGTLRDGRAVWAYVLLAATAAPPLLPNAALVVTGGVLVSQGR